MCYLSREKAIAAANGKPVYLCAETLEGSAVVDAPIRIFGGIDCKQGWLSGSTESKTKLIAPADTIPLTFSPNAKGSIISNLSIEATDAAKAGGSRSRPTRSRLLLGLHPALRGN